MKRQFIIKIIISAMVVLLSACKDQFEKPTNGVVILQFNIPPNYNNDDKEIISSYISRELGGVKPSNYPDGKVEFSKDGSRVVSVARFNNSEHKSLISEAEAWLKSRNYDKTTIQIIE